MTLAATFGMTSRRPTPKPTTMEGKYLVALKAMYSQTGAFKGRDMCAEHKISQTTTMILKRMGVIKTSKHGNIWIGDKPDEEMARMVIYQNGKYAKEKAKERDAKKEKLEAYARDRATLAKEEKIRQNTTYTAHSIQATINDDTEFTEEDAINLLKSSKNYKYKIIRIEMVEKEVEL